MDKSASSIHAFASAGVSVPSPVRPDLVVRHDGKIFLIDVTVPFENAENAFEAARKHKLERYAALKSEVIAKVGPCSIVPFVVGSLGSWDPCNDKFLDLVCSKSYAKTFRELCCSDVRFYSRNIYGFHTGRQRSVDVSSYHPGHRPTLPAGCDEPPAVAAPPEPVEDTEGHTPLSQDSLANSQATTVSL